MDDPDYLEEVSTAVCPGCGHRVDLGLLVGARRRLGAAAGLTGDEPGGEAETRSPTPRTRGV
jgi:hypothetical protein